jgi:hypothetical protein
MAKKPESPKSETVTVEDPAQMSDEIPSAVEEGEETSDPITPSEPAVTTELHKRLEKAVASIISSGNADAVHALHKVELLIGTLKLALSPAISATTDDVLKLGLQTLLLQL